MRFVGDLDNEFYRDEHQRDVWNEASAIGFQLCLWAAAIAMAVLPWVGGITGAYVAVGLFLTSAAVSLATLAYSKSRRVDVQARTKPFQPRGIVIAVLYVVAAGGYFVQLYGSSDSPIGLDPSTAVGAVFGAVVGGGAAAFALRRSRKKQAALDAVDEDL
jgi:membrane associated rhomboid family serine protease